MRLGDTLRRPQSENSQFVHRLLCHLEASGFPYAPRYLGVDAQDREILSFVEGCVPSDLGFFDPGQLAQAARVIALLHEATAGIPIASGQEVVCHGDLSPCNFVFRSGIPVCVIDFDTAAPGSRRLDVGYAAWTWLDVGNPDLDPLDTGRRLAGFLAAYGADAPSDPVEAILEAREWLSERVATSTSNPAYASDVLAWARRCSDWVRDHRSRITSGLAGGAA